MAMFIGNFQLRVSPISTVKKVGSFNDLTCFPIVIFATQMNGDLSQVARWLVYGGQGTQGESKGSHLSPFVAVI